MPLFFSRTKPPPPPAAPIHCGEFSFPETPHHHHLLLPDTTKTKAIRLQAIASMERYCLLSMYKGSAGRGGGAGVGNATQLWAQQNQGQGSAFTKQNNHPSTTILQILSQLKPPHISCQSSCHLVVVWLWMHLNPRGEHVCVEMHVDSAHGWMSLTPLTKTLLGKSVQSEVETESPRNL